MTDLDQFLRAAKAQGASDEFLVALGKQQGWPERAIYDALGRYYSEVTGLALPEPKSSLEAAREAFYHLLAFGTLGTWTLGIGSIWFELINLWLPDAVAQGYYARGLRDVSWQIAAVLVSFPVFAFATRSILRDMRESPEKVASAVRRWLTNVALLLAACVFIGDLVSFLAAFLQGELTLRFVLKSLVVLVLSGGIFLYYTKGLGARSASPDGSWHQRFAWTSGALIVLTLLCGFWKTGSPAEQRERAEDRRRVGDLSAIAVTLNSRWLDRPVAQRRLPASLEELSASSPDFKLPLEDPFTKQRYEYIPGAEGKYQLCAKFRHPSETMAGRRYSWEHPAGRHCFALDAHQTHYSTPDL